MRLRSPTRSSPEAGHPARRLRCWWRARCRVSGRRTARWARCAPTWPATASGRRRSSWSARSSGSPTRGTSATSAAVAELVAVDRADDERLADYRDLRDVELRKHVEAEHGLFLAEGEKVVRRAVEAGYR